MKPFIAVVSARFRTLLQYRTAAIAGIVTQIYWGCVRLMVLGAFFAVAVETPPMSFESVVVYVWLGQVLIGLIPWNHDGEFQELFTSGSVAYEMLRPLDLYWFWFARTLAFRTAPTLLRLVPGTCFCGSDSASDWIARMGVVWSGILGARRALSMFIECDCATVMCDYHAFNDFFVLDVGIAWHRNGHVWLSTYIGGDDRASSALS